MLLLCVALYLLLCVALTVTVTSSVGCRCEVTRVITKKCVCVCVCVCVSVPLCVACCFCVLQTSAVWISAFNSTGAATPSADRRLRMNMAVPVRVCLAGCACLAGCFCMCRVRVCQLLTKVWAVRGHVENF